MAQQNLNTSTPDSGLGDVLRDGFIKTQENFTDLYTNKVDKEVGKGLSANDYTTFDKAKLAGIQAGAEVNVQSDFLQADATADDFIKNKPVIPIFADYLLTGAYVGTAETLKTDIDTKADLVAGKVPASQLPSYVDDVLEFANLAGFPATGETGKIYLALDTNFTYRWTGSVYLKISDTAKQDKDNQIPISANTTLSSIHNGQTLIITANCTLTIPATLPAEFTFNFITLIGVNLTFAITAPHVYLFGTPATISEKKYGNFTKQGTTNNIIIAT